MQTWQLLSVRIYPLKIESLLMQNILLHLICCVGAPINMKSTSSKLLPSCRTTWRRKTQGRELYDLNRETYEDVITLAVKHLGMRIRPRPDNAFAMLAWARCFGGKWEGRNELEHIWWKKKKSHQQSLLESANRYKRSCFLLI